jgi:hypothetical protein
MFFIRNLLLVSEMSRDDSGRWLVFITPYKGKRSGAFREKKAVRLTDY